jgi:hypothetical protein
MRHDVRTTIEIEAPPLAVWAVLVDLAAYPTWNPFITSALGTVEIGGRLDLRLEPPGGRRLRFRPLVTQVEEARAFEWLGSLGVRGLLDGRHRFELRGTALGTELVHSERFEGLLVRAARRSLDGPTRAGFESMNLALRERVQATRAVPRP